MSEHQKKNDNNYAKSNVENEGNVVDNVVDSVVGDVVCDVVGSVDNQNTNKQGYDYIQKLNNKAEGKQSLRRPNQIDVNNIPAKLKFKDFANVLQFCFKNNIVNKDIYHDPKKIQTKLKLIIHLFQIIETKVYEAQKQNIQQQNISQSDPTSQLGVFKQADIAVFFSFINVFISTLQRTVNNNENENKDNKIDRLISFYQEYQRSKIKQNKQQFCHVCKYQQNSFKRQYPKSKKGQNVNYLMENKQENKNKKKIILNNKKNKKNKRSLLKIKQNQKCLKKKKPTVNYNNISRMCLKQESNTYYFYCISKYCQHAYLESMKKVMEQINQAYLTCVNNIMCTQYNKEDYQKILNAFFKFLEIRKYSLIQIYQYDEASLNNIEFNYDNNNKINEREICYYTKLCKIKKDTLNDPHLIFLTYYNNFQQNCNKTIQKAQVAYNQLKYVFDLKCAVKTIYATDNKFFCLLNKIFEIQNRYSNNFRSKKGKITQWFKSFEFKKSIQDIYYLQQSSNLQFSRFIKKILLQQNPQHNNFIVKLNDLSLFNSDEIKQIVISEQQESIQQSLIQSSKDFSFLKLMSVDNQSSVDKAIQLQGLNDHFQSRSQSSETINTESADYTQQCFVVQSFQGYYLNIQNGQNFTKFRQLIQKFQLSSCKPILKSNQVDFQIQTICCYPQKSKHIQTIKFSDIYLASYCSFLRIFKSHIKTKQFNTDQLIILLQQKFEIQSQQYSNMIAYLIDYAIYVNKIGKIYHYEKSYQNALQDFLLSLDIRKKVQGQSHPDYVFYLNRLRRRVRQKHIYRKLIFKKYQNMYPIAYQRRYQHYFLIILKQKNQVNYMSLLENDEVDDDFIT